MVSVWVFNGGGDFPAATLNQAPHLTRPVVELGRKGLGFGAGQW